MLQQKEGFSCLNELMQEGFVESNTLSIKGNSYNFFMINKVRNNKYIIAKLYKVSCNSLIIQIILNLKYFIKSKSKEFEDYPKLHQEEFFNKIFTSISELDESILILKYL